MNKKIVKYVLPRLMNPETIDWVIENDILHWIDHGLIVTLMMPVTNGVYKLLTNRNVIDFNLDEEVLLRSAVENACENYICKPLTIPNENGGPALSGIKVLYISTDRYPYGAGILLNTDVLDLVACDYSDKMVVLPSSVYEVIVGPYDENLMDIYENMLYQINTENGADEKLSDWVFVYEGTKHELTRYFKEEVRNDQD